MMTYVLDIEIRGKVSAQSDSIPASDLPAFAPSGARVVLIVGTAINTILSCDHRRWIDEHRCLTIAGGSLNLHQAIMKQTAQSLDRRSAPEEKAP